jgi:hypothetical protein
MRGYHVWRRTGTFRYREVVDEIRTSARMQRSRCGCQDPVNVRNVCAFGQHSRYPARGRAENPACAHVHAHSQQLTIPFDCGFAIPPSSSNFASINYNVLPVNRPHHDNQQYTSTTARKRKVAAVGSIPSLRIVRISILITSSLVSS